MNEILALQSREQKARNLNKKQQQQQQQSSEPRTKFLLAKDNIIKVRTKKIKLPGICLETRKENSEKSRSKSKSNSNGYSQFEVKTDEVDKYALFNPDELQEFIEIVDKK